jgi:hypothetical protein
MSGDERAEEKRGAEAPMEECGAESAADGGEAPPSEKHAAEAGEAAEGEGEELFGQAVPRQPTARSGNLLWFGTASSKRDGALAWLPAGTATPLTSAETPFQTKARENFAASKNRDVSTVSLRDVMESTEGVQGWAFVGVDVSSSGNLNRAMARELEKPQHAHVAKFVKYLPPHIAEKFRMAWASTPVRGFEFLEESKTSITYTKNTQGKDREWFTLGGLAKLFGDPNGEEEKELAWK